MVNCKFFFASNSINVDYSAWEMCYLGEALRSPTALDFVGSFCFVHEKSMET